MSYATASPGPLHACVYCAWHPLLRLARGCLCVTNPSALTIHLLPLRRPLLTHFLPPLPCPACSQLGLGDDKNRWVPRLLKGYTIIHPDRTLRRNRKPALKALLLKAQDDAPSRSRTGAAR